MTDQPNPSVLRRAFLRIEELEARLEEAAGRDREPLALVGLGCRLPGDVNDPDALWTLLAEGRDAIGEMPEDRWDIAAYHDPEPGQPGKIYTTRGGFLRDVDRFDAGFFGISPREAARLDPQQRLLLEVAWEALEHAGIAPHGLRGSRTGVYIGQATYDYAHLQVKSPDPEAFDAYFGTGTAASVASGRLSYGFGLNGPAMTLDTACSSSLVALHLACQALRRRECDLALVGGVNLILSPEAVISMCQSGMMAPDGRCKTFDAAADGFGQAEGCAVVVVKRLSDATRDGDTVLAMILGSAINQDGASSGLTAPSGPAQEAVIRAALTDAGVAPGAVAYVEAHGTGTKLGDPIEAKALSAVFAADRPESAPPPWVGSIKTNLGHLEAAAGLAGLLKVVLALQHRLIPAHLNFTTPNPFIAWDDIGIRVADRATPFPTIEGRRIAGLSAFGFSGTNVHVVIEEAPVIPEPAIPEAPAPETRGLSLLTLSARSDGALRDLAAAYRRVLAAPGADLADIAFSANTGRSPAEHRLAIIAGNVDQASAALDGFLAGEPVAGARSGIVDSVDPPRIAFLFPGDGLGRPETAMRLYQEHPVFRRAFDACDALFQHDLPGSLVDRLRPAADDPGWSPPMVFAPLLFTVDWALAALWRSWGVEPGLVTGSGIGEYVAACLGGVFSLEGAIELVAARAGLTEPNFAGPATAMLDRFEAIARQVPMADPSITIIASLTGRAALRGEINTARYWREQAHAPAGAGDGPRAAHALGYRVFLEIGPEPVQGDAAARAPGADCLYLPTARESEESWRTEFDMLSQLYLAGVTIDWRAVDRPHARRRVPLPTYPFQRSRYWLSRAASGPAPRVPAPNAGGHPHLTRRTDTATGDIIFETRLGPGAHPYLADHVVRGDAIVPTSLYLDLIASAVGIVLDSQAVVIENLVIHEAVSLPGDGRDIQLILSPGAGTGHIQLFARFGDQGWRRVVTGEFAARPEHAPDPAPRASGDVAKDDVAIDRFYDVLRGIGLAFGPSFRRMARLRRRDGEAEGEIAPLAGDIAGFSLHPAVLDACLQTLAAALPGFAGTGPRTDVYMPIAIDRFELFRPAAGGLRTLAWLDASADPRSPDQPEIRTGHVAIDDLAGSPVALITGVRMKRATAPAQALDDLLYGIAWRPAETGEHAGVSLLATLNWRDSAQGLGALHERSRAETGLDAWDALEPGLDALCAGYVLTAFRDMGWRLAVGLEVTTRQLAADVAPAHRRLLRRLLGILAEDGYLRLTTLAAPSEPADKNTEDGPAHETWRVSRDLTPLPSAPTAAELVERFPDFRPEILFAERGGLHLAAALRGEVEASEILFPEGSFELADQLYRRSPAALVFNALAAAAVTEAIGHVPGGHVPGGHAPGGRPLRVLEIGGGTGGVTSAILPVLPPARTEYVFTDLSPAFVKKAASDFATFPFVRYNTLNIEAAPDEQGFTLQDYDLIVASNVLHATRDLSRAMDHVRSLLAPGGQLLCLEGLRPRRWIDLSFGLTAGWWHFSDRALRRDYPLLPAADWRRLLTGKGFCEPVFTPDGESEGQALMLTSLERPATPAQATRETSYLVFADRGGVADALAARLRAAGSRCVLVRSGAGSDSESGTRAPDEFTVDRDVPESYRAPFGLHGNGMPGNAASSFDAILFLPALDCDMPQDATPDQLDRRLRDSCGSLLDLLRAGADVAGGMAPTLWLVTRSAQAVVAGDRLDGLSQTGILGIAKVIGLELPEIACRRFDLPNIDDIGGDDIGALVDELDRPAEEPMVALRDGRRYVARLTRLADMAPSAEDGTWPRQLEIAERGAVEGLTLRPLNRAPLSEGDVEIEVRAAGLNFRDVLNVLGARDDAAALGGEVAGLISRLGAGVHDLTIGQAVVAVTVGGMGDYAVAPAILVLEKPENLTFAQAAASPLAFLTAQYALSVVGRMAAGERVLIHAAAGGVGMAAVALARHAGLEVFATAGSEAKREILRAMGIRHVFDSRSTAFAAAIALATGGEGIDLVLSAVTGPAIAASLKLLRRGGRFLEIGKAGILGPGEAERINPWATYHTIDLAPLIAREPGVIRPIFVDLMAKLAAGILPPPPVESFALADARLAFRHMARARHVGKIVLSMTRPGVVGTGGAAAGVVRPRPDATYLISGGLTGLGLACARRLVERGARHLVLFGRRSPGPDALTAVDAMREAGARVTVAQADAGSEADMRRLFEGVLREGPPLGGVIHAAGRLEDAVLSRQTWTRFSGVLAPKTRGAWLLHRLTAGMPLDFFVLFSSAAALLGAPGQSNHAAANAFLDGLAHYRRARGLPGLSINWGAWADIGAAAERNVAARIGKRGVGELSVEEGLRAFEYLLDRPPAQVGVIRADWPRVAVSFDSATENPFLDRLVNAPPLAVPEEPVSTGRDASVGAPPALAPTGIAPTGFDLMAAAPDKRAGLLTSVVRTEVAGVLGTANPNALSDRRPFRDMGLDSLMALELRTRLKKALSLAAPLPATIAFDYPSIADIVDFLMTDIYGLATPAPARADILGDHAVLDDIEAMSDEDVDRLLALRARAS